MNGLPAAGIGHGGPWFGRWECVSGLQEFQRDTVRRADEGHVTIPRGAVDGDACGLEFRAHGVDIVHPIGKVAEIAAAGIAGFIPVMGEFDGGVFVPLRGEEDEAEAACLVFITADFTQAEDGEEGLGGFGIRDADHRVEIFGWHSVFWHGRSRGVKEEPHVKKPAKPIANFPPALPKQGHPAPHGRVGVVLMNLGTPDGTDYWSMRRYLKEFLSDPRVIEIPMIVWWFILNLIILTFRPSKSGHAYASIWDKKHNASPLRVITKAQTEALQARLGDEVVVDYAMRYGQPSIASVMDKMMAKGCTRIVAAPLYPQYSAATVATAIDKMNDWMAKQRWQPAVRVMPPYYDHPAYIGALTESVREKLASLDWQPDVIVASLHGLPLVNCKKGDVYYCHSHKTVRLMAESLGSAFLKDVPAVRELISKGGAKKSKVPPVMLAFQSRFGAQEWLKPYFAISLDELVEAGCKKVLVVCPGFSADCVETLEEIAIAGKESFEEAGGTHYDVVACLNASDTGMDMLEGLVEMELKGWI